MERKGVAQRLSDIFKEVFKEGEPTDSTSANDVKSWDSLNHIIFIKKLEEEFQIEFDLFDMIELKNVGDIINYIQAKIA